MANPDKVQEPSDMACSRFPNTKFSWDFSPLGISAWSAMCSYDEKILRETGPIGQR